MYFTFQALGCVLYKLCFNEHPFEDSAKLRIINANYTLPENDTEYTVFHDMLSKYITYKLYVACLNVFAHKSLIAYLAKINHGKI